jgi:hypothetical protein
MLKVYVGTAEDMLGFNEEHDNKLQTALHENSSDPSSVRALQIVLEGEEVDDETVIFTAIISQSEYQALVKAGAEEI